MGIMSEFAMEALYDDAIDISNIKGSDKKLTFGKYKGRMIGTVMQTNPKYLLWLEDNVDFFDLPEDVKTWLVKRYT